MSNTMMDTLATDIRILGRIVQETINGIKRTSWMNLVIMVTMASILSIFGTLFSFFIESQLFLENIGTGMNISVYLNDGTDPDATVREIKDMSYVKKVTLITKEQAWEEMKQSYQVPEVDNPLPNTIHVQLTDQSYIESTADKLSALQGVENVNYAKRILKKLDGVSKVFSLVGMSVSLFFGVLTVFIISNTIHLLIQARAQEIEILRMMGVGNWYIRLPFLFQGAMYGLVGAAIAFIPLQVVQHYIAQFFMTFQFSTSGYSTSVVSLILILMGILVGAGGAAISVHRFLRV